MSAPPSAVPSLPSSPSFCLIDGEGPVRVRLNDGYIVARITENMAQMAAHFTGTNDYDFHVACECSSASRE